MKFNLIFESVVRVLWFAIGGAIFIGFFGVVAGAVAGGLLAAFVEIFSPSNSSVDIVEGALFGSITALYISYVPGFFAFAIAGFLACFSELPTQVFSKTFRYATRAIIICVIVGGVLGPINSFIFGRFLQTIFPPARELATGYIIGVIAGFIIGTFYGALVGAKREIARQKAHEKAALSVVESAA